MTDFQMIPLSKLQLSEANVRKSDSALFIEEFADNIAAKGLLQNLIVVPSKKKGRFDVFAGGRRLRALNVLLARGAVDKDHAVPCRIFDTDSAEQSELSLIENVIRLDMTPTDEIRAYKYFISEGSDLDAIAKHFGRTRRFIEGRMRLADLAEPIFDALDQNKITLDVAKAYATTPNHERQLMVWNEVAGSWQGNNADAIKRMLTHSAISSNSPIAKLATEAEYLAAGGRIERELFTAADEANWIDPEIAQRIAGEKLQNFATEFAASADYAWVRPLLETRVTHNATEDLHQLHLEQTPLDDTEQAQADKLLEQISELEQESEVLNTEDEAAAEDFEKRWDSVTEAYDALTNKPGKIPDDMLPHAGVFVIIDKDGNPVIDTTVYSDKPQQRRRTTASPTSTNADGTPADDDTPKPLSQKLVDELAIQRRDILAVNLASNPAVALDYMIFCMADTGYKYGANSTGSSLRAEAPATYVQTYPTSPAHALMADLKEGLDASWTEHESTVARFDAFCDIDDDAKAAWLSYCMARTLEPSLGLDRRSGQHGADRNILHDRLAEMMSINAANHWRPTAANYFDRVNKHTLLSHLTLIGGTTFASSYINSKKGDLSTSCEKIYGGQTIIDPAIKESALAWVPDHMRFNAVTLQPEEPADEASEPLAGPETEASDAQIPATAEAETADA